MHNTILYGIPNISDVFIGGSRDQLPWAPNPESHKGTLVLDVQGPNTDYEFLFLPFLP